MEQCRFLDVSQHLFEFLVAYQGYCVLFVLAPRVRDSYPIAKLLCGAAPFSQFIWELVMHRNREREREAERDRVQYTPLHAMHDLVRSRTLLRC